MGNVIDPNALVMTEEELLKGLTEAMTFSSWRWTHILRSDGVTMGSSGLPDIIAVHDGRELGLAWELKVERGQLTSDQFGWLLGFSRVPGMDARVIRPSMYDDALRVILKNERPSDVWPQ